MEESESYPKMEQLSKNYHLCSWLRRLIFDYGGAILALPRDYNCAILERLRSPFIDYSGAKCTYFALKTATAQKSLF